MAAAQINQVFIGAAAAVMIMLLVPGHTVAQEVSCGTVLSSLAPCANYVTKGTPVPTPTDDCCMGVQQLITLASSQQARQSICACLKKEAASANPLPDSVSALPGLCNVNFPYSVSPTQDCSKIS